jgi:hypothetical protein
MCGPELCWGLVGIEASFSGSSFPAQEFPNSSNEYSPVIPMLGKNIFCFYFLFLSQVRHESNHNIFI